MHHSLFALGGITQIGVARTSYSQRSNNEGIERDDGGQCSTDRRIQFLVARVWVLEPAALALFKQLARHRERGASQPLMCGQVYLAAPLPAMMPMWPPEIRNSSLSALLTFDMMDSDWQPGVM